MTPGIVKLFGSPGRAGGLPWVNYVASGSGAAPSFSIVRVELEASARILIQSANLEHNESVGAGVIQGVNSINPYRDLCWNCDASV